MPPIRDCGAAPDGRTDGRMHAALTDISSGVRGQFKGLRAAASALTVDWVAASDAPYRMCSCRSGRRCVRPPLEELWPLYTASDGEDGDAPLEVPYRTYVISSAKLTLSVGRGWDYGVATDVRQAGR